MNDSGVSSKLFVLGIALGITGGIVIGSVIGMQLGEKSVSRLKSRLNRMFRQSHYPRFDLLLQ